MNSATLDQIVEAVLYEGYILYPYRPSSKKNRRGRFTFGRVYPEAFSLQQNGAEPCLVQTECVVEVQQTEAVLHVRAGFLHPMLREIGVLAEDPSRDWEQQSYRTVPELRVGKEVYQPWLEAVERRVELPPFSFETMAATRVCPFDFPRSHTVEPILADDQTVAGVIVRRQEAIRGTVAIATQPVGRGLIKVTTRVINRTAILEMDAAESESILQQTFASTHSVLQLNGAAFVSMLDPSPAHQNACSLCQNIGTWPVLVGDEQSAQRDTMLSSPIILYDYPKIAPESPGTLFDGTEIDEILSLRILTMTDEEKGEMRRVDEQARRLLERTEALTPESMMRMHGVMRPLPAPNPGQPESSISDSGKTAAAIEFDDFFGASARLVEVMVGDVRLRAGSRVRLRPKARADVIDLALSGRTAIVEAVEQDVERCVHLAVVLEDDPGKDLGLLRQPGHRFFYGLDEVEPLPEEAA
jgi:hydrogenase maturation protease